MNRKLSIRLYGLICITLIISLTMNLFPLTKARISNANEITPISVERETSSDVLLETKREELILEKPLQEGGLSITSTEVYVEVNENLSEYIHKSLMDEVEVIDISAFMISSSEVSEIYFHLLNYNPDLFHVGNSISYSQRNGYVSFLYPYYAFTGEEHQSKREAFSMEVEKIRDLVQPWMSDLEIALVVNDYLALHIDYGFGDNPYSAYGALVDQTAVCQGYALSYLHLMNNVFDIPTEYVVSNTMNHAWNMIQIDGAYYHVDVTWNDPTNGALGTARHEYFMVSDQEFENRGHYEWDSRVSGDSTRFDDAFWIDVDSPFARILDHYYYVDSVSHNLMEWDYKTDTHRIIRENYASWYYLGSYSKIYTVRGDLYYSMPDGIYSIKRDGSGNERVHYTDSIERKYPYGFRVKDEKFQYVHNDFPLKESTDIVHDLSVEMDPKVESLVLSASDVSMGVGQKTTLNVFAMPLEADGKGYLWISSNPQVVSVKEGVISALSEGTASISVYSANGDRKATVAVTVEKAGESTLSGIEISALPYKTQYIQGESLDLNGLKVEALYGDHTRENIVVTEGMITGYDSRIPVTGQVLAVTYMGYQDTFKVDIKENTLEKVEITSLPEKRIYFIGEKLDLAGLEVTGTYISGEKKSEMVTIENISGFDSGYPETNQIVTVTIGGKSDSFSVDILEAEAETVLKILAGKTRYSTAAAISKETYIQADTVILVQATNFPDALAAGPLAYMLDAPILLTGTTTLSATARQEIERLQAKKVIIMGGTGAVSVNVEDILSHEGYTVERVNGSSRYSTAVEAAKYMGEKAGRSSTVVLASGTQFADALAAGSYAAKEGHPILLTNGKILTSATKDYITESGVDNILVVGGTGVISQALEEEIGKLGITITRKSGANRFDTSIRITESFFADSDTAVVANGMEFADALAAAPYAAKMNAPIILVNETRTYSPTRDYLPTSKISRIIVVGGDGAVNEAVRNELTDLIR